jgi:hypothetical protein
MSCRIQYLGDRGSPAPVPAPGQVLPFHEGFHADDQEASGRSQPGNVRQRWRFNKYIDEIQPNLDKMKVVF